MTTSVKRTMRTQTERKSLIEMFPDATIKVRKRIVDYGPDNKQFEQSFFGWFWRLILVCLGFAIGAVVILILMGALKLLGVKTLE